MPLGTEVGLGPGHIVLDGVPAHIASPQKGEHSPKCLAHVYCGKTVGWIKMPFGMELGLGPGYIMLGGDPAPLPNSPPILNPCLFWPNGWMDQDATWYEGRPRSRAHSVIWGPATPTQRGLPQFSVHVYCGQTVAHLSYC